MKIQCSKKLLDELKLKPEIQPEEEAFFSWSAHLLVVNRRKMVVLMNDLSRYVVILYGLKAKDFKRLGDLSLEGIRETLLAEGVKEEVVEKYLLRGQETTFSKSKDRTSVARLNKACENVYFFEEYLEPDKIFNVKMSKRLSDLIAGDGKNSYIVPNEEMFKQLELFAGEPIFSTKAVKMKVTLDLDGHSVWRRLIVPVNRNFEDMHHILQTAFGWKESHLHEFHIYDEENNPIVNLVSHEEAFDFPGKIEKKMGFDLLLSEYLPHYMLLKYTYDFGDNWEHFIEVEETIDDYNGQYPVCLEGEGNHVPEDVGGKYGFETFLKIVADPANPEYEHTMHWGKMQGYAEFDRDKVNRRLGRL